MAKKGPVEEIIHRKRYYVIHTSNKSRTSQAHVPVQGNNHAYGQPAAVLIAYASCISRLACSGDS
jgi:hypothetical protein